MSNNYEGREWFDKVEGESVGSFIHAVDMNRIERGIERLFVYTNEFQDQLDKTATLENIKQLAILVSELEDALLNKVDVENGKGLSSNDFTDEYRDLLDNLEDIIKPSNGLEIPDISTATEGDVLAIGPEGELVWTTPKNVGQGEVNWDDILGKPERFAPEEHQHNEYLPILSKERPTIQRFAGQIWIEEV